jgi:S-adenosylmethionine:tRNA ribosyltransferase-isomerase
MQRVFTQTQLLITPGYQFKIAKALVTNFHQPQSTLLLLVAAAIGEDWKKCYQYALENDFRFLSYGDANLLFIAE